MRFKKRAIPGLVLVALTVLVAVAEAQGNSIQVFVYPISAPGATEVPSVGASDLAGSINSVKDSVFHACIKPTAVPANAVPSTPLPEASCAADNATEFVRGSVDANNNVTLTTTVFSGTAVQVVGSLALPAPTASATAQPLNGLTAAQVGQLLGASQVKLDGNLSLTVAPTAAPGSEQFIQLVPGSLNSTDPDYVPLLTKLLNDRGIAAQRSAFTLGAIGSNPGGSFCSTRGEQYLAYTVNTKAVPNPFIGTTRMNTTVTADYVTCAGRDVPTEGDARTVIPTSKTSALTFTTIFGAIWTRLAWTAVNGVIGTASGFADLDPNSTLVRSAVGETALRNMVDNLCRRLAYATPAPLPTGTPNAAVPPTTPLRFGSAEGESGTGASVNPSAGGQSLDLGALPGAPGPYSPKCTPVLTPRVVPSSDVPATGLSMNATVHASGNDASSLIQSFRAGVINAIPSAEPK